MPGLRPGISFYCHIESKEGEGPASFLNCNRQPITLSYEKYSNNFRCFSYPDRLCGTIDRQQTRLFKKRADRNGQN